MIKNCKEKTCCWPECDKTCGFAPEEDYVVGSSVFEELIYALQAEIERLSSEKEYLADVIFATREEEWD